MFEEELEAITLAERSLIRKALVSDEVVIAAPVTRSKLLRFELASFSDNIITLTSRGEDFASYTESLEADSIAQEDYVWRITFSVYLPRFQAPAISRNVVFYSVESNRLTALIAGHADTLEKFPGAVVKTLEVHDIRKAIDPHWENPLPTITITPESLTSAPAGGPTSRQLSGNGGTSPYTFAHTSGTLPTGMTLSSDGLLSGTPPTQGTYNFVVTVTDADNYSASQNFSMQITPAP